MTRAQKALAAGAGAVALVAAGVGTSLLFTSSSSPSNNAIFCSQFVPNMEASNLYRNWAKQNPGERDKYVAFKNGICAGQNPTAPSLATAFGKALVNAGQMGLAEQTTTTSTTSTTTTSTTTSTTTTTTTEPPPPPPESAFVAYSCTSRWYVDGTLTSGLNNGTSWANAWRSFASINWGSVSGGTCLYISGGSTSKTYNSSLAIGASGTSDSNRVQVLSGQDPGHNGIVIINGTLTFHNRNYVTVDGEGSDASTQHIKVVNGAIAAQSSVNPVVRFAEGDNSDLGMQYGSGGFFDYIYLHNQSGDAAFSCAARNYSGPSQYDNVVFDHGHIAVNNSPSGSGSGSDGIQGCRGLTVRNSLLEGAPSGSVNATQHQDLIQSQMYWISVYNNTFKDGADSSFDYDCYNGGDPNHFRIFNNVFIKARGNGSIRFYSSGNACTSFDNVHIDNNTFLDFTSGALPQVMFYSFRGNPTVTNSEIQNNVFYNDDGGSLNIDASSGFTAANWNVDYNNLSGGSAGFSVDGAAYTQAHPSTCAPSFIGYRFDSTPYSQTYAEWGGTDVNLSPSDICLANFGTSLASLFSTDKLGTVRPQGPAWDIGPYERVGG